jgi:hypothetical protein
LKGPAKFIRPLRGALFDSVAFDPAPSTSESGIKVEFRWEVLLRRRWKPGNPSSRKGECELKTIRFTVVFAAAFLFCTSFAGAQTGFDAYFGMGTARTGSSNDLIDTTGTGAYLSSPALDGVFGTFGGAVMLNPSFGVGAQVALRFRQGDYVGYGYRPIFYDFNGIWTPGSGRRVVPEFQAGFGGVNLRFYDSSQPYYDYNTGNISTYAGSSNHLQLHVSAGLRLFIKKHLFIRPQVDYHWARNMTEFGSSNIPAYTLAIGYSSGPLK